MLETIIIIAVSLFVSSLFSELHLMRKSTNERLDSIIELLNDQLTERRLATDNARNRARTSIEY